MFLILLVFLLTAAAFYTKRHYSLWQRLGYPSDESIVPYGSLRKVFRKERPFGLVLADIYEKFQDKVVGIYLFSSPTLLVRDAALVRQIMSSDFASFHDRGLFVDEKNDPLTANLFTSKGQRWRALRTKLTPSFTSGNLKRMFETVDDVAEKLINHINKELKDKKSHTFEVKDLITTYAVDIIGSVIFGLDIDSFTHPDNEFRTITDGIFNQVSVIQKWRNLANFLCPPLARFLNYLGFRDPVLYRLRDIVQTTIEYRKRNGVVRKDLLQSLIELMDTNKNSNDTGKSNVFDLSGEPMSIDMITSNSFLFYIAGSGTTAEATSFTLYELSMQPELLQKAQREVDEILEKHNLKPEGRFTYEAMQDMKFLSLCVMETTRKYPGLPFLNRVCTQDFKVPDSTYTISKGTPIVISLFGIHRDEQYFPNPMDYKPERYTEENMDYDPVAYMPFGEGPRHCIAQRMGVLNSKVALAKILANFNIQTVPRKEVEFKFHTAPVLVPKDGLPVTLTKRW